jgi:hypothetical protein
LDEPWNPDGNQRRCVADPTEEWRSRCADLRVTHVGGDHLELFEAERLDRLKTALLEALTSSEAGQGTQFHDNGKPAAASAAVR